MYHNAAPPNFVPARQPVEVQSVRDGQVPYPGRHSISASVRIFLRNGKKDVSEMNLYTQANTCLF